MTPALDLAGYLTRYPHEMAFGDEEPAAVLDRYHTPDVEFVNDGLLRRIDQITRTPRDA